MTKHKKGENGYIAYRLLIQSIKLLIGTLLIGGLLVTGSILNAGNRNNYYTLAAILIVLPTARVAVNFYMFWKHRKISSKEEYATLMEISKGAFLLSDLIVAIKEKIYGIDFAVLTDTGICCYSKDTKVPEKEACRQIENFVRSCGYEVSVTFLKDFKKFKERVLSSSNIVFEENKAEEIRHAFLLMCL